MKVWQGTFLAVLLAVVPVLSGCFGGQSEAERAYQEAGIDNVKKVKRGEIYWVDWGEGKGSEQSGLRPALIIQNDIGNTYSPVTIIAVITSQKELAEQYPTDVWVNKDSGGLTRDSIIQCDQIRTIDKKRIIKKFGCFDDAIMKKVNKAVTISLAIT